MKFRFSVVSISMSLTVRKHAMLAHLFMKIMYVLMETDIYGRLHVKLEVKLLFQINAIWLVSQVRP